MKILITIFFSLFTVADSQAQLLKKLKEKAEQTIIKSMDKPADNTKTEVAENTDDNSANGHKNSNPAKTSTSTTDLKVYSKFDFVPGANILYFDNFEKDNIGETPQGWITSSSAEVVNIEGLEGNWLKLTPNNSSHFIRTKKQSWGNNFTVEFDMLFVKKTYDPRIDIALINTGGNLVTDENILRTNKPVLSFSGILSANNTSRASLYAGDRKLADNMTENLSYGNTVPVHVSMCVQGKRFRMWWNDRKLYDLQAISEDVLPNQLSFAFGSVGGSDFYVSNIRIAKEVPDTRTRFEQGKLISNLLFFTGTANLRPESMGTLLDVSKIMKEAVSPVKIVGHTDSDGADDLNQKLSEQRAATVKKILVEQYSVDESKLTTEGRGETQPIAENNSAEGKAQNRRVEFIFKPESDVYKKNQGNVPEIPAAAAKTTGSNVSTGSNSSVATVKLQSTLLTTALPYAQFVKSGDNKYTFIASKEEGNSKENFIKIQLETVNTRLKAETFNFKEINQKNELYGTKKFSEINNTEAVLYYGTGTKPYINKFSPIITNGHMSTFVNEALIWHLPAASPNCKFVIEKVEDNKASGYFSMGVMIEGLKPVTKGDAMQQTFTSGFSGEIKCRFSNVPVY